MQQAQSCGPRNLVQEAFGTFKLDNSKFRVQIACGAAVQPEALSTPE